MEIAIERETAKTPDYLKVYSTKGVDPATLKVAYKRSSQRNLA